MITLAIFSLSCMIGYNYMKRKEVKTIKEELKMEQEQKAMFKREIDRMKYTNLVKDCDLDKIIIDKNINYKVTKPLKVLIGDYYLTSARNTYGVLNKMGIKADIVCSGDDIVERINSGYKYDLLIINNEYDCHSKLKYSKDVLDKLNEIDGSNIPVIVLTVSNKRKEFLEYGFSEHILKPLDHKKMEKALGKIFPEIEFERKSNN